MRFCNKLTVVLVSVLCLLMATALAQTRTPAVQRPNVPVATEAAPPALDVPRLANITIDGKSDDWKTDGFSVEVLAPVVGGVRAARDFAATARVGWNESGLLVLMTVRDDVAAESANENELWQKDSVELFLGDGRNRRDWIHVLIAPGVDAKHPTLRVRVEDHREATATLKTAVPTVKPVAASQKTGNGYIIEALLPFDALQLSPKNETRATLQIVANDSDKTGDGNDDDRAQQMFFPQEGAHNDPSRTHILRLADKPSPTVRVAYIADYRNYPRIRLNLFAPAALDKSVVTARFGEFTEAQTTLKDNGAGLAVGSLSKYPGRGQTINRPGYVPPALTLRINNSVVAPLVSLPNRDITAATTRALRLRFDRYVFAGATFPDMDFENPERASGLLATGGQIGDTYTLETDFYDASGNKVIRAGRAGRYGAVVRIVRRRSTDLGRSEVANVSGEVVETRHVTLCRVADLPDWRDVAKSDLRLPTPAKAGVDPGVADEQRIRFAEHVRDLLNSDEANNETTARFFAALLEAKPGEPIVNRLSASERDRRWWYNLRRRLAADTPTYPYLAQTPKTYDADKTKKWPLLLFLHGSGERGDDLSKVAVHGPLRRIREGAELPFVVVAPQCPAGERWLPARVNALVDELAVKYRIDAQRIYVTGLSMGGHGTWAYALEFPERIAAIAPICGSGDTADAARLVNMPIWNFHGAKDTAVPIQLSDAMIAAVKKAGAKEVNYTIYPDAGHDSWTETYANPKLYQWLLLHKRAATKEK